MLSSVVMTDVNNETFGQWSIKNVNLNENKPKASPKRRKSTSSCSSYRSNSTSSLPRHTPSSAAMVPSLPRKIWQKVTNILQSKRQGRKRSSTLAPSPTPAVEVEKLTSWHLDFEAGVRSRCLCGVSECTGCDMSSLAEESDDLPSELPVNTRPQQQPHNQEPHNQERSSSATRTDTYPCGVPVDESCTAGDLDMHTHSILTDDNASHDNRRNFEHWVPLYLQKHHVTKYPFPPKPHPHPSDVLLI
eukprot:m.261199 g.261199  ORF g.261199 m.261199 type:complete len:246 (-) comp41550_c0_seq1:396-1133(-)